MVETVVEKLAEKVVQQTKKLEKVKANNESGICDELRKRETRRANVVVYRLGEASESVTGRGRWDWDIESCENLFAALNLNLSRENIKFCRWVGEYGEVPRPLVVGFHMRMTGTD